MSAYFSILTVNCSSLSLQRRKGRESCQRLRTEDSKIKLGIKMLGVGQVIAIKVFVSRVQDPSFQLTDILTCAVELEAQTAQKSVGEVLLCNFT